jgi:hypothetical protein
MSMTTWMQNYGLRRMVEIIRQTTPLDVSSVAAHPAHAHESDRESRAVREIRHCHQSLLSARSPGAGHVADFLDHMLGRLSIVAEDPVTDLRQAVGASEACDLRAGWGIGARKAWR